MEWGWGLGLELGLGLEQEEHALRALGDVDSLRDPLARGRLEGDLEAAVDGGGDCARARGEGRDGEAR